jgi:asparagine synthase (glutamine-hydrolysing)
MCGICGIVNFMESDAVEGSMIGRMTGALAHRGPDDAGYFVNGRVGLGHRRLSIIDLAGGRQPIFNEDRSAAIVFNGEIYNYRTLAASLIAAGHAFKTRSDTETILHAYEEYGDACVHQLRGMFAFAIWDSRKRRLFLARDRLGIKPLYYCQNKRFIAFASEIKSLLEIASVPREVSLDALDMYLSLRYVPGPQTMFKDIFRLQPGHILVAGDDGVRTTKYWDIDYPDAEPRSPEYLLERFRELLDETARLHLLSEVPLGVFLSGGLDSSAILSAMSKITGGGDRVKTFSVGYADSGVEAQEADELEYSRLAAGAFGAERHEYRLDAGSFADFAPELAWYLDEPMADPSCIPLYFISKLAREHITVVLSGEGADETMAGYGIYRRMLALDRIHRGSGAFGRLAPWAARLTLSEKLRRYVRMWGQPLEDRYHGVSRGFGAESKLRLIGPGRMDRSGRRLQEIFGGYFETVREASPLNRMLYVDCKAWLPDDILMKADKMTMANGLELRVPFLDHHLVEFAATLPYTSKIKGNRGKTLLRDAMRGVLPNPILDRPKQGFPIPISSWLRTSLRDFTRGHLLARDSACGRYLDRVEITRLVTEHSQGHADRSQEIWALLVFELWHQRFVSNHARPAAAQPLQSSFEKRQLSCGGPS